jgi:hypothetical protein
MPKAITYRLGKDCILTIEDYPILSATDVSVRELVSEIDATEYNSPGPSTMVVGRTIEIFFSVASIKDARWLYELRNGVVLVGEEKNRSRRIPLILDVMMDGGLIDDMMFFPKEFTLHGVEADEPLDGAVFARFELRQFHSKNPGVKGVKIVTDPRPTER